MHPSLLEAPRVTVISAVTGLPPDAYILLQALINAISMTLISVLSVAPEPISKLSAYPLAVRISLSSIFISDASFPMAAPFMTTSLSLRTCFNTLLFNTSSEILPLFITSPGPILILSTCYKHSDYHSGNKKYAYCSCYHSLLLTSLFTEIYHFKFSFQKNLVILYHKIRYTLFCSDFIPKIIYALRNNRCLELYIYLL